MQTLNYSLKPSPPAKHTWKKTLLETRIGLFGKLNNSQIDKVHPPKSRKQKEVFSNPEAPLTHRLTQNKTYENIPLASGRRQALHKSSAKQSVLPQKFNHMSLGDEKQISNGETSIRKRRVTEGEMSKDRQVKQISFNITKRTYMKYSTKKVNYENFIEIFSSSSASCKIEWTVGKYLQIKQILGVGTFSEVRKGLNGNSKYAVKIYEKQKCFSKAKKQRIYKEISILSSLPPHRNIISLFSAFENKTQIHLIFQFIENSQNLQKFVQSKPERLSEKQIKKIFLKIVKGVAHLHAHGISHRDLKPANIIIAHDEDGESIVKIIDLGLAHDKVVSDLRCGTPNFLSPEQVMKNGQGNTFQTDIWALGVILFYLSESRYPFAADMHFELYQKIRAGKYEFSTSSQPTRSLINRMLQVNLNERITIGQLAKHSWFYC